MDVRIIRRRAAQACIDKFRDRSYKPGIRDCARLVRHDLHKLGIKVPFLDGRTWKSEAEGLRVLRALGFKSLIEAVDALGLPRIAPARALPSDIIALETSHQLGALSVAVGNGAVIGYTEASPNGEILRPTGFVCAWRTIDG